MLLPLNTCLKNLKNNEQDKQDNMSEIVLLKMNMSCICLQLQKQCFKDSDSPESQYAVWNKKVNMEHA